VRYAAPVTSPDAAAAQIHEAISAAYAMRGVALLNIPIMFLVPKLPNQP
jgi:thiamine pyrophosphate-dependent acetolactate synthase large subunit-like protein